MVRFVFLALALGAGGAAAQDETLPPGAVRRFGKARPPPEGVPCLYTTRIAVSPDGRTLAAGQAVLELFRSGFGEPTPIRLWDLETGRERSALQGHQGWVWAVAFSPDGTLLASGSKDRTAVIWDLRTGTKVREFTGHEREVTAVAFSPDGKEIISGAVGSIRVWDLSTGVERLSLDSHGNLFSVAVSANGRTLSSGCVEAWDFRTGRKLFQGERDVDDFLTSVSPDGSLLAACVPNGIAVKIFALPSGEDLLTWEPTAPFAGVGDPRPNWLESVPVDFSPDGRLLAAGSHLGAHVRDLATGRDLAVFRTPGVPHSFAWTPDRKHLLTGMSDTTVLMWALPSSRAEEHAGHGVDELWKDLAGSDAPRAYRAVRALAALGTRGMGDLKNRLQPRRLSAEQQRRIDSLLSDLDSDDVETREAATARLEGSADLAERELRRTMDRTGSSELRSRLRAILEALDRPMSPVVGQAELVRWRGIWVLEEIGSREARLHLESLARESDSSRERRWAAAAVDRLKAGR